MRKLPRPQKTPQRTRHLKVFLAGFYLCYYLFLNCTELLAIELLFLRDQEISSSYEFQNAPFGGISGGIQDPSGELFLISDHRGPHPAPRMYRAEIATEGGSIIELTDTISLRMDKFPRLKAEAFDGESIALDNRGRFYIGTEPDLKSKPRIPARIAAFSSTGVLEYLVKIPRFLQNNLAKGMRDNAGFESLAINGKSSKMLAIVEDPLLLDGTEAAIKNPALVRIIEFKGSKNSTFLPSREYLYPVDPLEREPNEGESDIKYSHNGVSDAIFLDDDSLLVLERGSIQNKNGAWRNTAVIYQIDLSKEPFLTVSTKGRNPPALKNRKAVKKSLVLDLNQIKPKLSSESKTLDNLEALIYCKPTPTQPEPLLLVISDNNFNATQKTQILSFRMIK